MEEIQTYTLQILQGSTCEKVFSVFYDDQIMDLTDYKVRLRAKVKVTDVLPVLNLSSEDVSPSLTISDFTGGLISLSLSPVATAALDFTFASYNLEIYTIDGLGADVEVYRILGGTLELSRDI